NVVVRQFSQRSMTPNEVQDRDGAVVKRSMLSNGNASSKGVTYKECRKNHAASTGGYAVDGCGEFIPSGGEGSSGAMICVTCTCHRNFHRREAENEAPSTSHGHTR
ncbi:hypothetical protein KI387_041772, partial [Taxus chinensis]